MGTTAELSPIVYSGEEQRLSSRRLVTQTIAVESALGEGVLVHDLGQGGAGVSLPCRLEIGSSAEMRLRLPDTNACLDVSATVMWNDGSGRAGLSFSQMSADSAATLKQWLETSDNVRHAVSQDMPKQDSALAAQVACLGEIASLQGEISAQELDRDAALNLITRRMAELTRASGAAIALREEEDVVCRASFGSAPDIGVKLSTSSLSSECLRTGNLVLLEDSENDPRVDPEICRQLNFRSLLILPVVSGVSRIGIAEVLSPTPHNFEGRDVLAVSFLTDLIASISAPPPIQDEGPAGLNLPAMDSFESVEGDAVDLHRDRTLVERPSPELGISTMIAEPAPAKEENASSAAERAVNKAGRQTRTELASADPERMVAKLAAPTRLPQQSPIGGPRLRQGLGKLNAATIAVGGAILLLVGLVILYLLLHRSTPVTNSSKGAASGSATVSVTNPAVTPSPAAGSSGSSASASTTAAKPVKTSAREAVTASSLRTSSAVPRELEVVQTSTRSGTLPTLEAAPEAPALSQLASRSSTDLPTAITAAKTATPGLGLIQSQGVTEGKLIKKVLPHYPELARRAGVAGDVILTGIIGTDGKLKNLKVLSGSPMLREEAIAAARQWRYTPYLLGGKPVETETHITINFHR